MATMMHPSDGNPTGTEKDFTLDIYNPSSLDELIKRMDRKLPRLQEQEKLHDLVHQYYARSLDQTRQETTYPQLLDRIVKETIPRREIKENERLLLRRAFEVVLEGFGTIKAPVNEDGELIYGVARMDIGDRYKAEHTLDVVRRVADPDAPIGEILTALFHDLPEDVDENDRFSDKELFIYLKNSNDNVTRAEITIPILGSYRLWMRHGNHYLAGVNQITEPRSDEEWTKRIDSFEEISPFQTLEEFKKLEAREIDYCMRVKAADKSSAVLTLESFRPEKRIRALGKGITVVFGNLQYLYENHPSQGSEEWKRSLSLTRQAAIDIYRSGIDELFAMQNALIHTYTNNKSEFVKYSEVSRKLIIEQQNELNKYIQNGLLSSLQKGDHKSQAERRGFEKTWYAAMLLSMHLDKRVTVPETMMMSGETQEKAKERLFMELQQERKRLPPYWIKEAIEKLPDDRDTPSWQQYRTQYISYGRRMASIAAAARMVAGHPERYLRLR